MLFALFALALPDAFLNQPYSPPPVWERVSTRCAMPVPVTRVVGGALPPGIDVSGRGDVAGIPTEPGLYSFIVEISDGCSRRQEQRQIRVMPVPILIAEAETYEFRCPQGAPSFSGGLVRISGSAPGRAYGMEILGEEKAGSSWLQAGMQNGVLPAEGSALDADTLRLSIHPGKLAPGNYTARLRVSTWQGVNTPELLFRLQVDSPQMVFTPIVSTPAPIPIQITIAEAPGVQVISPPQVAHAPAPRFPKYIPKPKPVPKPVVKAASKAVGRSRVLPFIRVMLPPKKITEKPAEAPKPADKKPAEKAAEKPAAKAEPKPTAKQEPKPAAKPEPKPAAKPEPKPAAKAEPKQQSKPEPKQAAKPESKQAAKPVAKPLAKADAKKEPPPERTKPSAMPPAAKP